MNRITKDRVKRWGLGHIYALRSKVGDWFQYPKEFPVYFIDAKGYLRFDTEKDLIGNPYTVINPRKDGSKLVRFTMGVGTGHRTISEIPGYVCMDG